MVGGTVIGKGNAILSNQFFVVLVGKRSVWPHVCITALSFSEIPVYPTLQFLACVRSQIVTDFRDQDKIS